MSIAPSRTVVVVIATFALAGTGLAAGTPAEVCAGAKLNATGKAASGALQCHAKAAQRNSTADIGCLDRAAAKLGAAFTKAEAKGGCFTSGDAEAIDALVEGRVGSLVAALRPGQNGNRCAAAKLKVAGKKAQDALACHAAAIKHGDAVDPACLAKAEVRFASAFAKAESRPPCLTTGDAGTVGASVDGLVDDAVATAGATTTTTSTTTTTLPDQCPCYTSAQLAATPLDFLDAAGGPVCGSAAIASFDTCALPGSAPFVIARIGIGMPSSSMCAAYGDLDADDDGWCSPPAPLIVNVTPAQAAACTQILTSSSLYQALCP